MYRQGDIVWIDYQFIGDTESKKRPCVIVSNSLSNNLDKDYLICPITSTSRISPYSALIENKHLSRSLPKSCEVRCNKVFTYREDKIVSKHCEIIDEDFLKEVLSKVCAAIRFEN
jgi:mRNA-degrading endonuclease toxin of MazEF toxin-antitoxin module